MSPATGRVPVQFRSQRTRSALVEAAKVEFAQRGYAGATAKSIATRAGVGAGTFYVYFTDKDAILGEIGQERVDGLLARAEEIALEPDAHRSVMPVGAGRAGMGVDDDGLAREEEWRIRRLVELYIDHHQKEFLLHAVIAERRICDPLLGDILEKAEREAVARIAHSLSMTGYVGDTETAAFMMFSLLEGAVHGHVLTHAIVPDAQFVNGLVEGLLRLATIARIPVATLAQLP